MTTDVLASIEARLREVVGTETSEDLGVLQRRDFLRFADAAGDEEYVAHLAAVDPAGPAEPLRAPTLYLPGILHWAPLVESELRRTGSRHPTRPACMGRPVNVMHGGQAVEFHVAAREGMHVRVGRVVRRAERKAGRTSPFLVVVTESRFVGDGATLLTVVADTILIVPR